jgi:hypothetical protein
MVQRTYYPERATFAEKPPAERAFTDPDRRVIRFGYTLRDLDQMTRAATIADRTMALDWADKRDIAWSAIAEELLTVEEPPERQHLIRVGWQAIYGTARDSYRARGYRDGDYGVNGEATMPRFIQFWGRMVEHFPEDRIIESIAADQIVATLTPTYWDALLALAVCDDYKAGAESLGISYIAFVARVNVARKQVLALWHEGETPHRTRRTDRRVESHTAELATHCDAGHEWTLDNTREAIEKQHGNLRKRRRCRACERHRHEQRTAARQAAKVAS